MKKLFLLPLLAITLTGCNNENIGKWVEVGKTESLGIVINEECAFTYSYDDYESIYYSAICENYLTTVKVKHNKIDEPTFYVDTFIGDNITIVVWGL